MTPRERFVATLTFGRPDRVPFSPGQGRESTLAAWHSQGLPKDGPWFDHLLKTLGIDPAPMKTQPVVDLGVDFRMIPQFEERVLEHRDGHLIVQDWKGNVCEIADTFDVTYLRVPRDFVTRRWIRCPVESRDDWERMKQRYRLDAAGRFADDFADRCRRLKERDYVLTVAFSGPFWQLREWCGFEPLCFMTIEQPDLVDQMAAFWTEFVAQMLERILQRVVPDMVHLSEDMAYKGHAMISPAMIRRFCSPAYQRWTRLARQAGCPLVAVDSDGFIGELIPIWIASGINATDPVEVAAGNDIVVLRREHGRTMAYRGGVDKRAMARGGTTIVREMERLAPVIRDGGYIPGCDHGVPADVSWPDFVSYARLLAELTGWL